MREHNLSATDRPDVMTRVFKIKLDQLVKDFKELHLFGRIQAGTIRNNLLNINTFSINFI